MNKLIHFVLFAMFISGCGKSVYLYKTPNFELNPSSSVFIEKNDSVRCTNYFRRSLSLQDLHYYSESYYRELPLDSSLRKNFIKKGVPLVKSPSDAEVKVSYQDYWLCRKKQSFLNAALLIEKQSDTTQKALVVLKAMKKGMGVHYETETEDLINALYNKNEKFYNIPVSELSKFPWTNDIPSFQKLQIGVSAGISGGTLPQVNELKKYEGYYSMMNKAGVSIGIDLDYFFHNLKGIGLKGIYGFRNFAANGINKLDASDNILETGRVADKINYFFIGPSYIARFPFYTYNYLFVFKISPGYLLYRNNAERISETVSFSKSTFGLVASAGVDFKLNKHVTLGVTPQILFSGFNKMKVNGRSEALEEREALTRVELGLSLKVN